MRRVLFAAVLSAVFFAVLQQAASAAPLPASAFAYEASAPLAINVLRESREGTTTVREITFPSPKGGLVHAQLMLPRATLHRGGALFVHWLGDEKTTNLTEFHRDALAVAQRGSVALLIDAMWAQPNWFDKLRTTDTDYANSIHQVVDLRRSLDVLESVPGVDPHRIAYVGHDFGAMYGAVLSGIDPRPRWYVLMAGTTTFSEWYLLGTQPADKAAYIAAMAPLDPLPYLGAATAQEFLFQFASKDAYITAERAREFADAAPLPHGVFIYKSDHSLNVPEAFSDRAAWLAARLSPSQ